MNTTATTPRANPLRAALAKAGGSTAGKPGLAKSQEELLAEIPTGGAVTDESPYGAMPPKQPPCGRPSEKLLRAMHEADDEDAPNELSTIVESIEVEAVVGGCLQRMRLKANTDPAQVKAIILAADPNALVRDAFPVRGGGSRETKTARAKVISARITPNGKFCDIICQNGDDITVAVSKKKAETFPTDLAALGRLTPHNIEKIQTAYATNGSATVILTAEEEFGVHYWVTDDGKAFMDSLSAEPPAAQPTAQN